MEMITLQCTFPGCVKVTPADQMRVPRWDSMRVAMRGKRVGSKDLQRFAHCGQHAHQVREDSKGAVQFMLYGVALASALKAEAEHDSLKVKALAHIGQFMPKPPANGGGKGGTGSVKPAPVPSNPKVVGYRPSNGTKVDAAKRPSDPKPAATIEVSMATQPPARA